MSDAREPTPALRYVADCPLGEVHLELPGRAADTLDAALALAAHEELLLALEAWLQHPLDPAPALGPANPPADVGLWWARSGDARVGMAWPTLAGIGRAPQRRLQWPALAFDVELAAFDEPPLPDAALGGMLLLPASFEPFWRVVLRAAEAGLVAEAQWRGPGSELVLCAPPEIGNAATPPWRVLLQQAWRPTMAQAMAWEPMAQLAGPSDAAHLVGPDGDFRSGRLAPALAGTGLWLDT